MLKPASVIDETGPAAEAAAPGGVSVEVAEHGASSNHGAPDVTGKAPAIVEAAGRTVGTSILRWFDRKPPARVSSVEEGAAPNGSSKLVETHSPSVTESAVASASAEPQLSSSKTTPSSATYASSSGPGTIGADVSQESTTLGEEVVSSAPSPVMEADGGGESTDLGVVTPYSDAFAVGSPSYAKGPSGPLGSSSTGVPRARGFLEMKEGSSLLADIWTSYLIEYAPSTRLLTVWSTTGERGVVWSKEVVKPM